MSPDRRRPSTSPEIAVLISGGIDSMACAHFYRSMNRPLCGVFVDYGQAAAVHEAAAAYAVAKHLDIRLFQVVVRGPRQKGAGEIPARNGMLLSVAAMERPPTVLALALGVHSGTPYADCGRDFLASAKSFLSFQAAPLDVLAPFAEWTKASIIGYSVERRLPLEITYSCETGQMPSCGWCSSCLDRKELDAGT